MIKFLISLILIFFIISCNEISNNNVVSILDTGIEKVEKIVEKKETKNEIKINSDSNVKNNSIFYYVGDIYFINGVRYEPKENYNYSEVGLSTFYSKELHNVKTVNNDTNKVTELLGRHKTLPLPSMVKITNLENGLSINIKIIDRHEDNTSIIQVSRKVAQLLGFYKDKIATVRVDILSDASKQWKNVAMSLNEPLFDETVSSAPTDLVSISNIDESNLISENEILLDPIELSSEEISEYQLFLKVSNFNSLSDIQSIIETISSNIKSTSQENGSRYELILGPMDKNQINNLVSYFISKGYKETKIILK